MVKSLIIVILFLMISCTSLVHNKSDFIKAKLISNQSIPIKINGFYYCEFSELNNNVDSKAIMTLLLYKDGYVIYDGVYFGNAKNYCTTTNNNENSFDNAISKYKSRLKILDSTKFSSCKIKNNDIDGKGLFTIENDSIKIQYYKAEMKNEKKDSFNDYFLYEFTGYIINNETFRLTKLKNYRKNTIKKIDLVYKFELDENVPNIENKFLNDWR
ncbi:hypothetical protein [Flavobacterium sp. CLA17]|uniref:hypothetical protein n=1 Tax=Flavobacterium sp. CLA17 TaxID=2724135 RepID=UPI001492DC5D|nr:hypothetical protein [Flavobacterium sp. CLA17]QSB26513.1 hypothetical protein HAV12_019435 [Flavobacterium sp. CLA17]